jgi:hypothetical protein
MFRTLMQMAWLSRRVKPSKREPGDSTGAGEDLELCRSCPRVVIIRLQNPYLVRCLSFECRKAHRATSEWWTTRSASKDSDEELLQANRSDESEEGISDRVKSSPSRAAVEAV